MRVFRALLGIGLSIWCSGCALIEDGHHNFWVSMAKPIQEHREKKRNRRWAEEAWQNARATGACPGDSADYAQGFKDGFAEFLYRGGDGEPPLVAPPKYRRFRYQDPEGYGAIQNWFAGFRHGASVARDTGARRWITGPSSLFDGLYEHPTIEVAPDEASSLPKEPDEPSAPTGTASLPKPTVPQAGASITIGVVQPLRLSPRPDLRQEHQKPVDPDAARNDDLPRGNAGPVAPSPAQDSRDAGALPAAPAHAIITLIRPAPAATPMVGEKPPGSGDSPRVRINSITVAPQQK